MFHEYVEVTNEVARQQNLVIIELDTSWHTYRIKVEYNEITIFLDGKQLEQITDNTYLSAGKVGLFDSTVQIDVHSFKAFTL